ncbi:MAG: TPM domain-containing protein [Bacteroidetes bacterium]|nr:MAG: TPM domain-containing protein [Bacteroidota bacterium]
MRNRSLWLLGLALVLAACSSEPRPAQAPEGVLIADEAGLLTPAERARLRDSLLAYHQATGVAYFVVTLPSLGGRAIEAVALERGADMPAGTPGLNNSAGIYLAPQERAIKIEAGRGLEWQVPDSLSYALLDQIRPALGGGAYAEAFHQVFRVIHTQLRRLPWQVAFTDLPDAQAAGAAAAGQILRLEARALPRDFGAGYMDDQFDPDLYLELVTPAGDTVQARFTRYMLDPIDLVLASDRLASWYLRLPPSGGEPFQLLGVE